MSEQDSPNAAEPTQCERNQLCCRGFKHGGKPGRCKLRAAQYEDAEYSKGRSDNASFRIVTGAEMMQSLSSSAVKGLEWLSQAAAAAPAYPGTGRATSDTGGSAESPPNSGPMYALGAVASASTPFADRDEDYRLASRRGEEEVAPSGPWTWTECPNLLPAGLTYGHQLRLPSVWPAVRLEVELDMPLLARATAFALRVAVAPQVVAPPHPRARHRQRAPRRCGGRPRHPRGRVRGHVA